MSFIKNNRAFTLIELLIAMSIAVILSTMAMPIYGNLQSATDLGENSLQVVQLFRTARTLSYNAYFDKSYGVYFDDTNKSFILYAGDNYAARDQSLDRTVALGPGFFISSSIVSREMHFGKWTGMPDQNGSFNISHRSTSDIRQINVNALGVVDME